MNARSLCASILAFTILAAPALAAADSVALLPLSGNVDQDRLEAIEGRLGELLREQGHRLAPPPASATVGHPPTSAQMEAIAESSRATYVITGEIEPMRGQYRLHVHVYYRPAGRLEELLVTVLEAEERERLADVLRSMVRREGLGEDAVRLTGDEDPEERARREAEEAARRAAEEEEAARRAAEEEERARREAEEAARRAAEEEEAARRAAEEEEARRAREAFDARVPYGADGDWMVQLSLGGRYAGTLGQLPSGGGGGGLFDAALRLGRSFEGLDGFELRGGVGFTTGAFTGLGIHVGPAWLGSFLVEPIFIGLGGDVGVIFTFTGARDVGFTAQVSALFAWRPAEHFYLEASIPELGYASPGAGVLSIGASLRAGYRF